MIFVENLLIIFVIQWHRIEKIKFMIQRRKFYEKFTFEKILFSKVQGFCKNICDILGIYFERRGEK